MKEEQTKTAPLEEVCAALREDLDGQHKKRMESFETKMKPIIIKEGPSKKVLSAFFKFYKLNILNCTHVNLRFVNAVIFNFQANYKIAAAKLHYEIYALTQRLRLTTIRVEYEEAVRFLNILLK